MKTKEIIALNTTDTYRLKDKEGWLGNHEENYDTLSNHIFDPIGFTLDRIGGTEGKEGFVESVIIISDNEYEFFEVLIQEDNKNTTTLPETPLIWNPTTPLEVGMLVAQGEVKLLGVNTEDEDVAIVMKDGAISTYWRDAIKHIKTEEEVIHDKVVDFVNSNRNTTTGKLADVLIEGGFKL